jgi:predicted  nucleic acid-binding Zn-ribbon protein
MSSSTNPSQIRDIQYSIDANFKEMRTNVVKIDTMNERTEEQLGSLRNRLDQAEVSLCRYTHTRALLSGLQNAVIGLNKLEDDIENRFASLRSSIGDYQERMDGATQEWQDDFGSSTSITLQRFSIQLPDIS